MAKAWSEVASSDAFKALAPEAQEAARAQYFDQVVAPKVSADQLGAARAQFDSATGPSAEKPMTQEEYDKESFFDKVGGPKPGEKRSEFKQKVESVDTPFPDILPGGSIMANAVAREGGGLAGVGKAIAKGAVNVGKDVLNTVGAPVKYALRGSEKNLPAMQANMNTFSQAGAQPSAGQATGGRTAQALESLLSKTPGGAGRMAAKATEQQAALGQKVKDVADSMAADSTPFTAGRTIDTGLKGFVKRFKSQQNDLYNKVDQFVPQGSAVNVSKTAKALADMNQDIEGAAALSKFFKNGKIQDIETALKSDTGGTGAGVMIVPPNASTAEQRAAASHGLLRKKPPPEMREGQAPLNAPGQPTRNPYTGKVKTPVRTAGNAPMVEVQPYSGAPAGYGAGARVGIPGGSPTNQLPYAAVKKLRTLVGNELENGSLVSDVPRSKWKALYAALSSDLEGAAKATGNADAVKAMDRANAYTKAGHDRIDSVLDNVQSRKVYEDVYKAATNPADMKAGASKIQGVMKSLSPEERDVVRSTFIRDLGHAKSGVQNAEGDVFSSQTFLTQWNNMSPQAKDVMFVGGEANQVRKDLDAIAQAASKIKEGSKVFANPSGTGPSLAHQGLGVAIGGATVAAATGHVAPLAGLIGGLAATNGSARLMTNPKFVGWLAKASKIPEEQLAMRMPVLVNVLRANMQGDPDQQEAENYANAVTANGVPK